MSDKMTDEEAIEALTDKDVVNPYLTLEALEIAIGALKERAERKSGKWIKDIYGNVVCSECRANRRDNRIGHIAFCNSCGAKMEVEE